MHARNMDSLTLVHTARSQACQGWGSTASHLSSEKGGTDCGSTECGEAAAFMEPTDRLRAEATEQALLFNNSPFNSLLF